MDRQGAPSVWLGSPKTAARMIEATQIVKQGRHIQRMSSTRGRKNAQRATVDTRSLSKGTAVLGEDSETGEDGCRLDIPLFEVFFRRVQGRAKRTTRLGMTPQHSQNVTANSLSLDPKAPDVTSGADTAQQGARSPALGVGFSVARRIDSNAGTLQGIDGEADGLASSESSIALRPSVARSLPLSGGGHHCTFSIVEYCTLSPGRKARTPLPTPF